MLTLHWGADDFFRSTETVLNDQYFQYVRYIYLWKEFLNEDAHINEEVSKETVLELLTTFHSNGYRKLAHIRKDVNLDPDLQWEDRDKEAIAAAILLFNDPGF